VLLEDRHGRQRLFPLAPGAFQVDGVTVTLRRPGPSESVDDRLRNVGRAERVDDPLRRPGPAGLVHDRRTASGSIAVGERRARVARQSRIWVEGDHDAALVERVWGDDLRVEGVVVESLSGVDLLVDAVARFGPGPGRRLGVLVDHLVPGSKESRVADRVAGPYVLVAGHPYVDIWQAVRPAVAGIAAWPEIPPGQAWKQAVCDALGRTDPARLWREVLARVGSYRDLETPLVNAVERLIDHVTATDDR
jgi:hypothetical protein